MTSTLCSLAGPGQTVRGLGHHCSSLRGLGGTRGAWGKRLGRRDYEPGSIKPLVVRAGSSSPPSSSLVTVGEALYDCLASDGDLGRSVEEVTSWEPYPGGAPANVATAVARLGDDGKSTRVVFVTSLGRDGPGEEFLDLLNARGVDTSCVQRSDLPTREVLVTRDLTGDREFAGFRNGSRSSGYADCEIGAGPSVVEGVVRGADVCVMGTLGLAYPTTAKSMTAIAEEFSGGSGGTLVIDVNWRPVFWDEYAPAEARRTIQSFLAKYAGGIVKITDEEVAWLFDGEISREDALKDPMRVMEKLPNAQIVLVSAGEFGSSYACRPVGSGEGGCYSGVVPVLQVDRIADTTGAGDAYLAGFLHFMLKNGGIERVRSDGELLRRGVEFATACGAATCMRPGAIGSQPTEAEALALLERS
jgi:fructokinase